VGCQDRERRGDWGVGGWEVSTKEWLSNNIHGSVHYTIDTIVTVFVVVHVVYLSAFFTHYCSYTINSFFFVKWQPHSWYQGLL